MTPLRKRMIDDMVAAGLSANTQAAYIRAVCGLAKHFLVRDRQRALRAH